jgi:hypothetical protein
MAQNYTQTRYIRTACTQAVVAHRNADAILAIARFVAAILVSPAPLSVFEKREGLRRGRAPQRLGLRAHELEGAAATTRIAQCAGVLREALDAPRPRTGPPVTERARMQCA